MVSNSLFSFWSETNNANWFVFFTLICAIFALFRISRRRSSSPPLPPGPRGLPLVGNLLSLGPELHSYLAGLARTYGPIYKLRLGAKLCIMVNSPSAAREVLHDHDVTFANRDFTAAGGAVQLYGGTDMVCAPYGPEWGMFRKVCAVGMLSKTHLDSVHELRHKQVRKAAEYLYGRAGSPVKVGELVFLTMVDVTTSMLWGDTLEEEDVTAELRKVMSETSEIFGKPNISDLFPGLARFDLQGTGKKMKRLERRYDGIFERVIDQRLRMEKQGAKESNDFLNFLLKLKDEGDDKTRFTMTNLKALLMDMVVGGGDTSTNTIEFAMAEIMNKPEVYEKAHQELEAIVGKDSIVEESHLHKLPYLSAVVKETLRLHPPLPLLLHHCPTETCTVGGYTIPKGCRVFINAWAIHRDPSNWENPLVFDPDRFWDSKYDYTGSSFNYLPFGSGRRICPGEAMGERLVMHLLATLLHNFDWKMPQGDKLDLSEKFGFALKMKVPLVAIPTPRLSNPQLYKALATR